MDVRVGPQKKLSTKKLILLGREDSLEEGMVTHSSVLALVTELD